MLGAEHPTKPAGNPSQKRERPWRGKPGKPTAQGDDKTKPDSRQSRPAQHPAKLPIPCRQAPKYPPEIPGARPEAPNA